MSLSRAQDPDRAPRFFRAVKELGAKGYISDLDDSPILQPLSNDLVEIRSRIASFMPHAYDFIFTHDIKGEYTRHERHEQVSQAVQEMILADELTGELFCFAYNDCNRHCAPRPASNAGIRISLTEDEHRHKQCIIRDIYGFSEDSFEFNASGPAEAFNLVFARNVPKEAGRETFTAMGDKL